MWYNFGMKNSLIRILIGLFASILVIMVIVLIYWQTSGGHFPHFRGPSFKDLAFSVGIIFLCIVVMAFFAYLIISSIRIDKADRVKREQALQEIISWGKSIPGFLPIPGETVALSSPVEPPVTDVPPEIKQAETMKTLSENLHNLAGQSEHIKVLANDFRDYNLPKRVETVRNTIISYLNVITERIEGKLTDTDLIAPSQSIIKSVDGLLSATNKIKLL